MTELKQFWQVLNAFLMAWYMIAAALVIEGRMDHWAVLIAGIILAAHVLEIPLAIRQLKDRNPSMGRLAFFTILFGFTWWFPARKGLYSVQ